MAYFLATFSLHTTISPGDDGMRRLDPETMSRIIIADSEEQAREKLIAKMEVYEPYRIATYVYDISISEAIE